MFVIIGMCLQLFHKKSDYINPLIIHDQPPPLTSVQWAEFIPKFLFLPYLLVGEFTWDWLDIHWWTARFILAQCLMATILEATHVAAMLRGEEHVRWVTQYLMAIFMRPHTLPPCCIYSIFSNLIHLYMYIFEF